jgi:hypothetical protein
VDYSLDYYIVDCTVENKTDKPVDAGDYMLRLHFFDKNGKSTDEFLRLFKADNSGDEVKTMVREELFGDFANVA